MKVELLLTIDCAEVEAAEALEKVLEPDNTGVPRGQTFRAYRESRTLSFAVRSEGLSSSLATTAAVLNDVALFEEVWLLSHRIEAGH